MSVMAAVLIVHACAFALVSIVQPEPYMDEFFHVPQAKRFCVLDSTWDNKITTLPGKMWGNLCSKSARESEHGVEIVFLVSLCLLREEGLA